MILHWLYVYFEDLSNSRIWNMILDIGVLDIMRALREIGKSVRAETQEKKAQTMIRYCEGDASGFSW